RQEPGDLTTAWPSMSLRTAQAPARCSRQLAANTICVPAFRLPKRTFATGPMLSILGTRAVLRGLAACVPYREDSTTDRWLFGRQVTWLRQSRDILQLFQRYVITVRSLACRSK